MTDILNDWILHDLIERLEDISDSTRSYWMRETAEDAANYLRDLRDQRLRSGRDR
jgi:hypothetical protein